MRLVIDHAACSGHARCGTVAPGVFVLDELGYNRMPPTDVPPELEEEARRGADGCPERAIHLSEG